MPIKTTNNKDIINLDTIDRKLFFYLSQDVRWPQKQLAKKLNISPKRLGYRIERLCNELIEPIMLINFPLLGINSYALLIEEQLDGATIKHLEGSTAIYHLTQCIGAYRHLIHVVTNDLQDFLSTYLPNTIISATIPIIRYVPDDFNGYLINEKPLPLKKDKPTTLNEYHKKILSSLIDYPLASMLELSQKTGIDRRVVRKYFDELCSTNIIQKFRYILNSYKTGFATYFLLIQFPLSIRTSLITQLRTDNYAGFLYESHGFLYMWYLPPDHDELFSFISRIEKQFPSTQIKTLQPTDIYQLSFMPEIVKEKLR